ncbi:MAG: transposase [Defluviitaleaceae bacterium]|nr:transposase [Defluviitaleaceae bacterium]
MIRLFAALCKSFLEFLYDDRKYQKAADGYIHNDKGCPHCGAIGMLGLYGGYSRWLVFRLKGKTNSCLVWVRRFKCESCDATHALLPDVLIPYSPYSLHFKLTVLIAYFERDCTVVELCEKFGIAVSTLYEWKKRLASHKDLMIGVLSSKMTPVPEFIRDLIDYDDLSGKLSHFFSKFGFSFMQRMPAPATLSNPP